jgi:hypothetical protein
MLVANRAMSEENDLLTVWPEFWALGDELFIGKGFGELATK